MKKTCIRWAIPILLLAATARPVPAQEFYVLGGVMETEDSAHNSYSWQLEYMQGLVEHAAFSVSYLNEGHVPSHHRDGTSGQIWARTNLLDRRLSLAAGVGPYYYFDTTAAKAGASFTDDHGWKAMVSLAATWYTDSRWLFQVRSNWVTAGNANDTVSAVAGIGYQLDRPPSPGPLPKEPPQRHRTTDNELTVFIGRTIINSFNSEHSVATSIEYRRGLWQYVDWTVAWLYEGDNHLLRRDGLATQLWAVRDFLDDRLALGIGGGAYFAVDHYAAGRRGTDTSDNLAGIVTLTGSYRIHRHWDVRTSWNRIVTDYNRDTDIILGGVGYRF